jgi:hypothetical protein
MAVRPDLRAQDNGMDELDSSFRGLEEQGMQAAVEADSSAGQVARP